MMVPGRATDGQEGNRRSASPHPEKQDAVSVAWADLPGLIAQFGEVSLTDHVLDVPCADGALAFEVAPSCRYIVGLDSSESQIASAATRDVEEGLANTSFQVGRAEHLEFADGTFDRVFCWDGLHHFQEPPAAIRELVRVLRSPGYLILVDIEASDDRIWREIHNRIEHSRDPAHRGLFGRAEVRTLLEAEGMSIERETRWKVRRSFDKWMAPVNPDAGTTDRTRRLLTEAARKRAAGLEIMIKGRSIEVVHRLAAWMCVKLSS
jgi:SAM-dependent methyltransferase